MILTEKTVHIWYLKNDILPKQKNELLHLCNVQKSKFDDNFKTLRLYRVPDSSFTHSTFLLFLTSISAISLISQIPLTITETKIVYDPNICTSM